MRKQELKIIFKRSIDADEILQVCSSPIHNGVKGAIDHGSVVFFCEDCSARLEFLTDPLQATLSTHTTHLREIIEILEEVSHGEISISRDSFSGEVINSKDLPVEYPNKKLTNEERDARSRKRLLQRRVKARFGIDIANVELDLLYRIDYMNRTECMATVDEFGEAAGVVAWMEEIGLVTLLHDWRSIVISKELASDERDT